MSPPQLLKTPNWKLHQYIDEVSSLLLLFHCDGVLVPLVLNLTMRKKDFCLTMTTSPLKEAFESKQNPVESLIVTGLKIFCKNNKKWSVLKFLFYFRSSFFRKIKSFESFLTQKIVFACTITGYFVATMW